MSSFTDLNYGETVIQTHTAVNAEAGPSNHQPPSGRDDEGPGKKKTTKRRKVNHACLYCRRSHMTCDDGRPCQRCIKREIGHLCHDERKQKVTEKQATRASSKDLSQGYAGASRQIVERFNSSLFPSVSNYGAQSDGNITPNSAWPLPVSQGALLYQPETFGNEFSVLTYVLYVTIPLTRF
jgi:hypothetical protein